MVQNKNVLHEKRWWEIKVDKKKLEIAMARACMSAAGMAEAIRMPRTTVNNAIAGREVRPATAGKIARALGVDVTEIIED